MAENLLNIKETALYLRMNKMTVYKLAKEGKIPAFKISSEWRFKQDLIDQWLMGQLKDKFESSKLSMGPRPAAGKAVLIVDDEQVIRDFFARVLTDYRVLTAASGEEAIEIVRKERPDLVLLDIKMPGIGGMETLRRIKDIDNTIEVVMLSAYGTLKTNMEAARLGAHDSMSKPFDLGEIKAVIQSALTTNTETGERKPAAAPVKAKKARR